MHTRYRLRSRIGKGGMAEVFDAEAVGEDGVRRRVAVKRLIADADDRVAFTRMFLDEARITSQLHHNNIVSLVDYGTLDGDPFQVLEFVDGRDAGALRNFGRAHDDPMPIGVALAICHEVARGLNYAHGAKDADGRPLGIVHRDVSPANVLVSWDGDVKLADFGIALSADREERTKTHVTKGKLSYMSPEQATAGSVDHRSDIFSLGCTLYSLLTGSSPLRGEAAMMRMLSGREVPLSADLPTGVSTLIARALAHDRAKRFANAGEMSEALRVLLATYDVSDPRTAISEWARGVQASAEPSPPSVKARVDELLDVALLLDATDPSSRQYTTKAAQVAAERPAAVAPTPPERIADAAPKKRMWAWLVAPLVAAIAAGVGLGLARDSTAGPETAGSETAEAETGAPSPAGLAGPEMEAAPVIIAPSEPQTPPTPPDVNALAHGEGTRGASLAMEQPARRDTATMRAGNAEESAMETAVAVEPTEALVQTGTVFVPAVAGQHLYYVLDGRVLDRYLGQRISVPVGAHRLSARSEEQELGPLEINVLPTHTPSSPLRVRFR